MTDWDAIGAISEIIAAAAVLVTLIYLAIQIKHTRSELQTSAYQETEKLFTDASTAVSTSPDLARALALADSDRYLELEDWQMLMVDAHLGVWLNAWEVALRNSESGVLTYEHEELRRILGQFVSQPWARRSWARIEAGWSEELRAEVNAHLASSAAE